MPRTAHRSRSPPVARSNGAALDLVRRVGSRLAHDNRVTVDISSEIAKRVLEFLEEKPVKVFRSESRYRDLASDVTELVRGIIRDRSVVMSRRDFSECARLLCDAQGALGGRR